MQDVPKALSSIWVEGGVIISLLFFFCYWERFFYAEDILYSLLEGGLKVSDEEGNREQTSRHTHSHTHRWGRVASSLSVIDEAFLSGDTERCLGVMNKEAREQNDAPTLFPGTSAAPVGVDSSFVLCVFTRCIVES